MNIQETKACIISKLNNYLGGVFRIRRHSDRARDLQAFVNQADNMRDICLRIVNEHCLFNLGYSLINVNEEITFEHGIKNINIQGRYYSTVISPIFEYLFSTESNFLCKLPIESASNYNKTLIFRENSDYTQGLKLKLAQLGINYKEINEGDKWARDIFFNGEDKVYNRTKDTLKIKTKQLTYPTDQLEKDKKHFTQDKLLQFDSTYLVTSKYLSLKQNMYDQDKFMAKVSDYGADRGLGNLIPNNLKKETIRLLEGGNLFEAINSQGDKYYFIGINALLNEVDLNNLKHGAISSTDMLTHRNILTKCHKQLARYKKIFGSENIMILPQWAYHLDLQMSYVGKSTFLIHSFNEVVEKQQKISESLKQGNKFKGLAMNAMEREKIVTYISAILKSCGFNAVLYAGVLHKQRKESQFDENVRFVKKKTIYATGNAMQSSFVNGIDIYSARTNKYYFLTIDSPNNMHKNYLTKLLNKYEIEPIFLKINGKNPKETLELISEEGGALRCQTNFLPNAFLA